MSRIISETDLIALIDGMDRIWWGAVRAEHWPAERARLEVLRADYAAALNPNGLRIWNVACTVPVNGDAGKQTSGMAAAILLASALRVASDSGKRRPDDVQLSEGWAARLAAP